MTRTAALLTLVCAFALLAGCGGSEVAFTEVKSDPPTLPIPRDEGTTAVETAADADAAKADATTTPDPTDATVPTDSSTTTTTTAPSTTTTTTTAPPPTTVAPTDDSSGGAAPPVDETTPTEPEPDTGGSGGATFDNDQFCADNPGACNN
jgi:hypothetical protein